MTLAALTLAAVWAQGEKDVPKRVSVSVALKAAIVKVQPAYPPIAKQLKIQGNVDLEALVGEDGTVQEVRIAGGNPILTKPAAEALKRWKFRPFETDGKPVKTLAPVSISFKLGE